MRSQQRSGRTRRIRVAAAAASAALAGGLCAAGTMAPGLASASPAPSPHAAGASSTCHLGDGIKHVVQIGFDNVHFFRDNPNVPSDLQMMPNLLNFFENNGSLLTNSHTPLIAHTANDLLTTATGLYGDRQGEGISNSYQTYNPDGTTDPAESFTYWTDPIDDSARTPATGHDVNPNLVYSPTPPNTTVPATRPDKVAPAPWVPYTRAGCNVGEIATVNQELENPVPDLADAFGASSPEVAQLNADTDSFKDAETADYVGLAVHCARGSAVCANAQAVKFGQTSESHTAVPDVLPDEPGGYHGYQALFGNKYIAPVLGGGMPDLTRGGYQVTDAAGNLVDLDGNQINGDFLTNYPGFPGYGDINAAQSLAYAADMLESGVQVTNIYIADLHGNEFISSLDGPGQPCFHAPAALGSGSACYVAQAQYYNAAFGTFFQRLAAAGMTAQNTLFVLSSDEGDHEAGANANRSLQPTPANCDGATVSGTTVTPDVLCTYPAGSATAMTGSFGELNVNVTGLLAAETGNTTRFSTEDDTAPEFYLTGDPGPDTPATRNFEHDVASLTTANPYAGQNSQALANYIADPAEMGILHITDADPARTPTIAVFAKPDYYVQSGALTGPCAGVNECQNTGFAWDHGDYAAEINTNYIGLVGPGVRKLGLDGPAAGAGPSSDGPDSGQLIVAKDHLPGPWTDETDIRPTIMYLLGLRDDYTQDGRVITQVMAHPNRALGAPGVTRLGECYKQINSSVGAFAADTLQADTNAIEGSSPGDRVYLTVDAQLRSLEFARDHLAGLMKGELAAAAFQDKPIRAVDGQVAACRALIGAAHQLERSS